MKINCTYVNLGLLLLFLCNLGSIHGYFIRFCSSLCVRSCFPTKSEARQVILCRLNSQISSASKNRAPIHHKNAKSLRPGDSLISSSRHGYCGKMFWRFSVLVNLKCAQELRWLVRVAWWTRTIYIRSSNCFFFYPRFVMWYWLPGSWSHVRVHHAMRGHRGSWTHVSLPRTENFQKIFHKKHIAVPMTRGRAR